MPTPDVQPQDTCARCGLKRATKALEEKGTQIRLCDDCYWGQETQPEAKSDASPAA